MYLSHACIEEVHGVGRMSRGKHVLVLFILQLLFPWLQEGTVKPFAQFDPEADCKTLQKAMKGLFKDEGSVIHVLANRSNQQRQQLKLKYKVLFGKVRGCVTLKCRRVCFL